jgi:putative chitinase
MRIFHLFGGRGRRMGLLVVLVFSLILTALPTAVMAAPAYNGHYHKVRHGETLSEIAKHYGVSLWALAEANDIENPNTIYAGQHLYIPPPGSGYHGGYGHDDNGWKDNGCGQDCYGHDNGWKDNGCGQDCYGHEDNGWKDNGCGHGCYGKDDYGWKDDGYGHKDYGWKDDGYKPAHHGGGYAQCSAWHYVRKGDILGKIAKWYGSNATAIAKVNGISNPSLIYVGQKLCIPSPYAKGGYGHGYDW